MKPKSIRTKLILVFLFAVGAFVLVDSSDRILSYLHGKDLLVVNRSEQEISRDESLESLHADLRCQQIKLVGSVLVIILGFGSVFIISNHLSRSIYRMALTAKALSVGDYRRRVCIRAGDEIEALGKSLNVLGVNHAALRHSKGM